ncbi:hypothetical protein [Veillonella criceti]|uniref:Uncharacterized protein n=1 Tax=Veillonella criceti TaxID=103891 RepID=A0A380NL20_9FIRM|nr:hypothetical protein [Veillonella criceti]SUP42249.1 Uncharacterised protein [Veillonella criceti]
MIPISRISDAIDAILSEKLPHIPFKQEVLGPTYPKELTAYICCDTISYEKQNKGCEIGMATYTIQIICPNPKGITNEIEGYAMDVCEVLRNEYTLDDWAMDSHVKKVIFATPAGISTIGVAVITLEVEYYDE